VQQVLMTVNIALRRQLRQLDYFTEGSIPDALIGVPQGWTSPACGGGKGGGFAGDLAKRRRAKFVPGETAATVVQTKEPQHKDDFDEWLARIICFAFSVPRSAKPMQGFKDETTAATHLERRAADIAHAARDCQSDPHARRARRGRTAAAAPRGDRRDPPRLGCAHPRDS
jgi:hypothetical protein